MVVLAFVRDILSAAEQFLETSFEVPQIPNQK